MRRFSPWPELLLIPLAINGMAWGLLYSPAKKRLQTWREVQALVEEKPRLEQLLRESHEIQATWEPTLFSKGNPSEVVEAIQKLAGLHGVEIASIHTQNDAAAPKSGKKSMGAGHGRDAAQRVPGFSTMAVHLELVGGFGKLARWVSDVESQYGLQIDAWTINGGKDPGQPSRMTLQMTAFLKGA